MSYIWTDDPIGVFLNSIREIHIDELRDHLNQERSDRGLSAYSWTDDPLIANVHRIRAIHIQELRQAIDNTPENTGCYSYYVTVYNTEDSGYDSSNLESRCSGRDITVCHHYHPVSSSDVVSSDSSMWVGVHAHYNVGADDYNYSFDCTSYESGDYPATDYSFNSPAEGSFVSGDYSGD